MIPVSLVQIGRAVVLSFGSVMRRRALTVSTVLSTALVTTVLLTFLAMAQGVELTTRGANATDIALVLRAGTDSEGASAIPGNEARRIKDMPGVAYVHGGPGDARRPLVSRELYIIVSGRARDTGAKANVAFRGIPPEGLELRPGTKFVQGRPFTPGTHEVVVGRALLERFSGFDLGSTIRFGGSTWQVVGVFESQGSVYESEIWGDDMSVQHEFAHGDKYQVVRVQLESPAAFTRFAAAVENDSTLNLEARTEHGYYNEQATSINDPVLMMGWSLAVLMGLGALAGAVNTMSGSVAARAREIATLRALGFRRIAVFGGTLIESLGLALLGAALGSVFVWLLFQGLPASTTSMSLTQIVYQYSLSGGLVVQAAVGAVVIGLLGGLMPARNAARAPIAVAIRG